MYTNHQYIRIHTQCNAMKIFLQLGNKKNIALLSK